MIHRFSPEAVRDALGLPRFVTVTGVTWNPSDGTVDVATDEPDATGSQEVTDA